MDNREQREKQVGSAAFTLIELLVVVAILAVLLSLLLPALGRANQQARSALCKTNLAGLARANELYAGENADRYVPAASDIFSMRGGNTHRWHGVRDNVNAPFDPARGPLAKCLGGGEIKQCPSFVEYRSESRAGAYESGSGGYGYSHLYVGSTFWQEGFFFESRGQLLGARTSDVKRASETVMFTDAAMAQGGRGGSYYTEESFAYCVFGLDERGKLSAFRHAPSVHFRHMGAANVVWCDAHVTGRDDFHSVTSNVYGANPEAMKLGWFGPDDNSLFDLE